MLRFLLLHSSVDGHTVEICRRLQAIIEERGHAVTLASVEAGIDFDLTAYDKIVIGASIRYGRHRKHVFDFIKRHLSVLQAKPSAFFSVNIVARKAGKGEPDTNPYMRKFLRTSPWRPRQTAVFAGKLDYPRYGFLDRSIIRLIMFITRGPTDPSLTIDFTDWQEVDAFGRTLSES